MAFVLTILRYLPGLRALDPGLYDLLVRLQKVRCLAKGREECCTPYGHIKTPRKLMAPSHVHTPGVLEAHRFCTHQTELSIENYASVSISSGQYIGWVRSTQDSILRSKTFYYCWPAPLAVLRSKL